MSHYPKYNDIIGRGSGPSRERIVPIENESENDYDPDDVGSLAGTEIIEHPDEDPHNIPQNVDRHMEILNNGHVLHGHDEYARTFNHIVSRLNNHLQFNPDINRRIIRSIDRNVLHAEVIPANEQQIMRRALRGYPPRNPPRNVRRSSPRTSPRE